ncbi:MAG: M20 family metallopeptidase [Candidatus Hodarchaeota archaeon]
MLQKAKSIEKEIIEYRRYFHMYPELGFQEFETAKFVEEKLECWGITSERVAGTGVVGHLGEGKPCVAIRADMDALPIQEENNVPYQSQKPGLMHACGHDAHTAMLLGIARLVSEEKNLGSGEIRFLFQPAEETQDENGLSGAVKMIKEGALEGVDIILGQHIYSELPAGTIDLAEGYTSAGGDVFVATITGKGCHGAYPHKGIDPISIASQVVLASQAIIARRVNPLEPAVLTIGKFEAGSAANVIPEVATLEGTIRYLDPKTHETLLNDFEAILQMTRLLGGDYKLKILSGYPPIKNDSKVFQLVYEVATEYLGTENINTQGLHGMGSEDFSYFTQKVPGTFYWLGGQIENEVRPHHTKNFDISEDVLHIGTAILAESTLRHLKKHQKNS